VPANEPIGAVAYGCRPERRRAPLIAWMAEQMRRQDTHVVHRVVEHFGIPLPEPKDGVSASRCVTLAMRRTWAGTARRQRIGVRVERELDIRSGDGCRLPGRGDRDGTRGSVARPFPFLRKQRLKVLIAQLFSDIPTSAA